MRAAKNRLQQQEADKENISNQLGSIDTKHNEHIANDNARATELTSIYDALERTGRAFKAVDNFVQTNYKQIMHFHKTDVQWIDAFVCETV